MTEETSQRTQTPHSGEPSSTSSLIGILIIVAVMTCGGIYYLFFK